MISLSQYWWVFVLCIVGIMILVVSIVYRKRLKKKIENEIISFTALVISLTLAIISFVTKPRTQAVQLATIGGREVSLFFPITAIFIVALVVSLIIFFRKELAKDMSWR